MKKSKKIINDSDSIEIKLLLAIVLIAFVIIGLSQYVYAVSEPDAIVDLEARIENETSIYNSPTAGNTLDFASTATSQFAVQQTPDPSGFTQPTLIDSVRIGSAFSSGGTVGGTIKGVIVGDRSGSLETGSLLSDIYFIENSTNTYDASVLTAGGVTLIFNFSGNTILDSDDPQVGIGLLLERASGGTMQLRQSGNANHGTWDGFALATSGHSLLTNSICSGSSTQFVNVTCNSFTEGDLGNMNVYGGNARAVLNWTAPADNGDPITGYHIQRANSTIIQTFDEGQSGETGLTREVIGTDGSPLGIIGQRITFPTDVTLNSAVYVTTDGITGLPTPSGTFQGVVVQGGVGTSTITRIANSTKIIPLSSIASFDTTPSFTQFEVDSDVVFDDVILEGGVEYIIGIEILSSTGAVATASEASDGTTHPNSGLGTLTELSIDTGGVWADTAREWNANLYGLNFVTEILNTSNTNTEFTSTVDIPSEDREISAYDFIVEAINSNGNANASNIAGVAPDRSDSIDVWQYREHKNREFFSSNCEFEVANSSYPPANFGLNITSPSGGISYCHVLKSFDADLIDGSDLKFSYTINPTETGGNAHSQSIWVIDGSYDIDNRTDFPQNEFVQTNFKGGGELFLLSNPSAITYCDTVATPRICEVIIPAEDIDYASSTEDEITVLWGHFGSAQSSHKSATLKEIQISNVGSWNFTQSPRIITKVNQTLDDAVSFDSNQDDRGTVASNSIFNGTLGLEAPENVVATADLDTVIIDWDAVDFVDRYWIERNVTASTYEVIGNSDQDVQTVWTDDFESYPNAETAGQTWVATKARSNSIIEVDMTDGTLHDMTPLDGAFEQPDSISVHTEQGKALRLAVDRLSNDKVVVDLLPIVGQTITDANGIGDFSLRWTKESVWCKDNNPIGAPQSGTDCYSIEQNVGLSDTGAKWGTTANNGVMFEWLMAHDSVFVSKASLYTQNDSTSRTFKFQDATCADGSNTRTLTSHYDSAIPTGSKFGKQHLAYFELNKTGTTYSVRAGNAPDFSGYSCSASGVVTDVYQNLRYLVIAKPTGGAVPDSPINEERYDNFELALGGQTPASIFVDNDVQRATNYHYRVYGENAGENGTAGVSNNVLTNDVPDQIQNLMADNSTAGTINLQWNALNYTSGQGDPSTGLPLLSHDIWRNDAGGGFVLHDTIPIDPTGWDEQTLSFVQSSDIGAQDLNAFGVYIKPDGTRMFVVGDDGNDINEYLLTVPFDISTKTFVAIKSVSAQTTAPRDVWLKPDGTKMFVTSGTTIFEYSLGVPFSVTSASFTTSASLVGGGTGMYMRDDGKKLYIADTSIDEVDEYDISTAWSVSTLSYLQTKVVSPSSVAGQDVFFKPDGKVMFLMDEGASVDQIDRFDLSTAWDISTATFTSSSIDIDSNDATQSNFIFSYDGLKIYTIGSTNDDIYEYDLDISDIVRYYNDTDININVLYEYKVGACNGIGCGDNSTSVFASLETPSTITDLQVFPITSSIFMNWTEPMGSPDFYLIERTGGDDTRLESDDFLIYHQDRTVVDQVGLASGTQFAVGQEITTTGRTNVTRIDVSMFRDGGACLGSGVLRGGIWGSGGTTLFGSGNATVSGCSLTTSYTLPSQVTSFYFEPAVQLDAGTYNFGVNMTGTIDKTVRFLRTSADEVDGLAESAPSDTFPYTFASNTGDWGMNIRVENFTLIANITSAYTNYTDHSSGFINTTSPTLSFDFSSAVGWTTTDSATLNVNTVTEVIDFDTDGTAPPPLQTKVLSYDVGIGNISDTNWTLRFPLNITALTYGDPDIQVLTILLSDNTSTYLSPNDSIGLNLRVGTGIDTWYEAVYANSQAPTINGQVFGHFPIVENVYVQIKRPSATTATVSLYSNPAYTILIEEEDLTIPAGITGLRYIKLVTLTEVGSNPNELNGNIDSMDFYNDNIIVGGDLEDGITYYYRVRGENDIGLAVNGSNIAYTKEPILNDGNSTVINSTSPFWYYRESDVYTCILCDPIYDFTTVGSGHVYVDSGGGSATIGGYGDGYILKSFEKADLFGSNITVGWSAMRFGPSLGSVSIRVYDGAYNAKNNPDFPLNDGLTELGGGLLGSFSTTASFTDQFDTLSNSSISWGSSTEDFVTVAITNSDPQTDTYYTMEVENVTISNIGTWEFDSGNTVTNLRGNVETIYEDFWDAGYYDSGSSSLNTPQNFVATAVNATVVMDWDDVFDAISYIVNRNGIQIGNPSMSEFTDSSPALNTLYNYSVFAVGLFSNSSEAFQLVTTNDIPTAPQNLTGAMGLVIPDLEDVFLEWEHPADNGTGSPSTGVNIIHYQIERKTGVGAFAFLANTTNATASYEDDTVISGGNYTWKVRGVNAVGFSPFSNEFSIVVTPFMSPNAPTALTATTVSGSQIDTQWVAPVGGDPPTSYVLQRKHVGFTGFVTVATIPVPTIYYNNTGLLSGNTYEFRVRADNGAGSSAYSNIASATTYTVPSAPQTLNAITFNNVQIDLTWASPAYVGGGITTYSIYRETPVGGGFAFIANVSGITLSYNDLGLTQNTVYNYRISATNLVGTGVYSNQDNDKTQGVPDAPINLAYETNGVSVIDVDWDSPVYTGGVAITGYTIDQATGIGGTFVTVTPNHPATPTEKTYTGLLQDTYYIYRIASKNVYGTGAFSANLTASTFSGIQEPENLFGVFDPVFPYNVDLTWSNPFGTPNNEITFYTIQRLATDTITWVTIAVQGNTTSYSDFTLHNQNTNTYRVKGQTIDADGQYTLPEVVSTQLIPQIGNITVTNSTVAGNVLKIDFNGTINECFPTCQLYQVGIIQNGTFQENIPQVVSTPRTVTAQWSTFYTITEPANTLVLINATTHFQNTAGSNSTTVGTIYAIVLFDPNDNLFFTHQRNATFTGIDVQFIRQPIPWSLDCEVTEGLFAPVQNFSIANVGSWTDTFGPVKSFNNAYVTCYDPLDNDSQILSFTSFGMTNGTTAVLAFTNNLGDFLGVPVPFIFILFLAAIWTGRSASTGIIFMAVAIGAMGVLGYFPDPFSGNALITGGFWALIVLVTAIGVFVGKRYF